MKPFIGIFHKILNEYYQLIKKNGSLIDHVFDLSNTSLLYTLSYIWRNPIVTVVFQVSNFVSPFELKELKNSKLTLDSGICCICIS